DTVPFAHRGYENTKAPLRSDRSTAPQRSGAPLPAGRRRRPGGGVVIRGVRVMLSAQTDYDVYHQAHDAQYQAYVAGESDELRPDMEVAEGVTRAIGPAGLLEAMGLNERPSPDAITALGTGRHPVTGEQLVAPRPGYDRVAYNDLIYSVPTRVSVEYAAAGAAGDHVRGAQLVDDVEVSV